MRIGKSRLTYFIFNNIAVKACNSFLFNNIVVNRQGETFSTFVFNNIVVEGGKNILPLFRSL